MNASFRASIPAALPPGTPQRGIPTPIFKKFFEDEDEKDGGKHLLALHTIDAGL